MTFYESIFITRQDISSSDVDKIVSDLSKIVVDLGSKVIKTEYWGLRNLAYEINNNKKGHYVFLGLEASPAAITEMERKMKLSQNIIRFLTLKVEAIETTPSPILRGKNFDGDETIDVTIGKDF